ncbi:MAG TPA: Mov34/MPN/PAD-1 family protein [bacterium]|nr:Mov34/MPN/PAD-1 family protein [bacterium]
MQRDLQISSYVLDMMIVRAEKEYPNEACGIVIGPKGIQKAIGVFPIRNIQDELHEQDSQRYPRQAKTAYQMEPKEVKIVEKEAASKDFEIKLFYHSHPDHGVYFSEEDRAIACPWGEPSYPEVGHVVISVEQGKAAAASEFFWNPEKKDFEERKLR